MAVSYSSEKIKIILKNKIVFIDELGIDQREK
ncbi:hypothetical protein OTSGILL_1256 [Orientia tsutsugamushi str. Gilliam]|uniref:Transposase n=2 Tax=Orientia tsutsugamushi TaxID=784 RepID=A0A0F3MBB9_ORITS|nr:hypothetical protein OTSGILL_1256 [Orientia tsutsugamushi str. Gilliam]KJV54789.1 hypothetical protein OTSKARP_0974 [Orientia tsutsugamushi str. Karp]KJV74224.1 hypothetical protein OTSTA763_1201 [Orientia tsutsugamushi str. TA763]KJW05773.1 hypothetical protein OTSSIDO_0063 [Orientia tsutsugamushi str. Sido]SPP25086.1 Uncharacterised protein [Orientia tsutsugamushi]